MKLDIIKFDTIEEQLKALEPKFNGLEVEYYPRQKCLDMDYMGECVSMYILETNGQNVLCAIVTCTYGKSKKITPNCNIETLIERFMSLEFNQEYQKEMDTQKSDYMMIEVLQG